MKRVVDFLEETLMPLVAIILAIGIPLWILYKILWGLFYLLNKLIDKI